MSQSETQDNLFTVQAQLLELKALQSAGNSIYPKGVFPSQRYHPFLPYKREDDNLFFTTTIVRILQELKQELSSVETELADLIIGSSLDAYSHFRNKDGLDTYNFWQTSPTRHFPNGSLMGHFKHFQIPDDVDDTALVYLTENADADRVSWLKEKLKAHANLAYKQAHNPHAKYKDLKCYSTFFGKKMYIEFDICVLSNLMSLIHSHPELELNEYDLDTLEFICSVIESNEHISQPFYSSPNYPTTELILYHLARLIPSLPKQFEHRISEKIQSDLIGFEKKSSNMNQVLLQNAMLKLGIAVDGLAINLEGAKLDNEFFYFHAGMVTAFENRLAQLMASKPIFHLRYASKALNRALLLENFVLKRKIIR